MKKIILIAIIFISWQIKSQEKGYKLENLISQLNDSELVAFNLIIDDEKEVLIATNQGVFTLEKGNISNQVSEIAKWARFDFSTKTFKSTTKLELVERNEFLIEISEDNFYYRIIDRRLVVYTKRIYQKYLEDKSIRAISKEFIGTYDGIYDSNLKRLDNYPSYSSGKIRKFDNKTFVLYDGLFYAEDNQTHYFKSILGEIEIDGQSIGFGIDVLPLKQDQYLLFTSKGVWKTDLLKAEAVDLSTLQDRHKFVKLIHQYEDDDRILYILDNQLKLLGSDLKSEVIIYFEEEILDITKIQNGSDIYFLSNQSIGMIRNSKIEKIVENSAGFHTIMPLSDQLVLTSDQGLFRLDNKTIALNKVITEEFNKQSLEVMQDSIWAGSVSGLYKMALRDFETYESKEIKPKKSSVFQWILYCLITVLFIIILILTYKLTSRSKAIQINEAVTKEMIVKFLKDNIETVTLISIQNEFNISYRKLVSILGESPGKVIEFERKKILYAKSNKGKSIEELSKLTGYSVQYLKKISKKS